MAKDAPYYSSKEDLISRTANIYLAELIKQEEAKTKKWAYEFKVVEVLRGATKANLKLENFGAPTATVSPVRGGPDHSKGRAT